MNLTIWTEEQVAQIREALESVQNYFPSTEESEAHTHDGLAVADVAACQKALTLLVPTKVPESVMEVVEAIHRLCADKVLVRKSEVAALIDAYARQVLIDAYARQVLGAMLEEISDMGDPLLNDLRKERIPAIVAKHGYLIKE